MKRLYIIKSGNYYKIGISENPVDRLAQLKCGNPIEMELIFESEPIENPYKIESALHKKYSCYRLSGEWYSIPNISKEFQNIKNFIYEMNRDKKCKDVTRAKKITEDIMELFFGIPKEYESEIIRKETEQMKRENEELENFWRSIMGTNAPNIYTNLIYRTLFGKTAKELEQEYGVKAKENLRDFFTGEDLAKVQSMEMLVSSLINCGWGYEQIKEFIKTETMKMIA